MIDHDQNIYFLIMGVYNKNVVCHKSYSGENKQILKLSEKLYVWEIKTNLP